MPPSPPCAEVDGPALMQHTRMLARHVKLSGTPEEAESLRYVEQQLRAFGYGTKLLHHDAYISLPGAAAVVADGTPLRAITQSFSRQAPLAGLTAELVDGGDGSPAAFAARDVRGRIVLLDGIATPGLAHRASLAGAAGQIHVSPHQHLHEMCISPVWGSPGSDTVGLLPQTVVCTVPAAEGAMLRARVQAGGNPAVTLHAAVETGWRKTPILVAELDGPDPTADATFILFSGHHDTWHYGVMDNGTANATMLELARICAAHRTDWRRGLRLCFWSGHSHGRFSGSAWYADEHWAELDQRCAAHVNVDSPGAVGAWILANTGAMSELGPLAREAVRDQAGQGWSGARMPRGADMSFSGVGVPAIFGDLSEPETGPMLPHSPWWHTPEDLLDKVDKVILARDARVCLHGLWRLLTDAVLPLDYAAYADALLAELASLQAAVADRFSLASLVEVAHRLRAAATALSARPASEAAALNQALMRMSRALVPIAYSRGDRFSHDAALPSPAWQVLQPIRALAASVPDSDELRFMLVSAIRAHNQVGHALRQAIDAAAHP